MRSSVRPGLLRGAGWWSFLLVVSVFAGDAAAQAPAGAGRVEDPFASGAAHAWLVLPVEDPPGSALVHVPPRRAGEGGRYQASERGTLLVARRLITAPRALGAWGDDVFVLMPETLERPARVLSLRAVVSPVGESWSYEPRTRLRAFYPLPKGIHATSLVGSALGVVVLGTQESGVSLVRFEAGAWVELGAPSGLAGEDLRLLPDPGGGVNLLSVTPSGAGVLWTLGEDGWGSRALGDVGPAGQILDGAVVGARVVLTRRTSDAIDMIALTSAGSERIALIEGTGEPFDSAFQGRRFESLVLAWEDPPQDEAGEKPGSKAGSEPGAVELIEISTATGQVFYRGFAVRSLPIGAAQFRLLAASLAGLMAMVLLIVLKPSVEAPMKLPEGFALAEPTRRLFATVIDVLIAAFIVSTALKAPLVEVITFGGLLSPGNAWMGGPGMLVVGFVVGGVSEWAFGRTLGKLSTGCRVVDVRAGREGGSGGRLRPVLWRSLVRNIVKWALPPIAALALIDPSTRHRGDVISGLAVVIPTEQQPEEPADDG